MSDLEERIKERIAENEAKEAKPVVIFGRDVSKIPCFKESFFTSIVSSIGIGIAVFMFTSRPLLASHSTAGSFGLITLGYYSICTYKFYKEKEIMENMKGLMQEALTVEGLEHEEKVKEILKLADA